MARKSNNLDKKLLRVGARQLQKKGAAALSIREVAKIAGVNLGMFNYHFKDKNEFIMTILRMAYLPFIAELKENQTNSLEEVLLSMAKFSRNHHQTVLSLLRDALAGEKNVIQFLRQNFTTHFAILQETLKNHFEQNGYNPKHKDHAFRYLISTIGIPNLMIGYKMGIIPKLKIAPDSDEFLHRRVRAAMSGLDLICRD